MRTKMIPILSAVLLLLIVAAFFTLEPESGQQVLVELGLAEPDSQHYTLSGLLEADTVTLSAIQGGAVLALPAAEGDSVSEGELIATLDSALLVFQRDAAQARLDVARSTLNALQIAPRAEELIVAEAAVAQAQALLDAAQRSLEKVQDAPGNQGFEEREQSAMAVVEQALAGLEAAEAILNAVGDGANSDHLAIAEAVFKSAEAELSILDAAIQAQSLVAPMDGVITELYRQIGETVAPGWPIAGIASLDTLSLTVYLPESDLGLVHVNAPVEISTPAFPDSTFSGTIIHIASEAEFTPRNVQTPRDRVILVYAVEIEMSNPNHILKPGLSAIVSIEVES